MEKTAKIYVAGHHGLVGSAIWNNLQQKGYTNLVGRSHKELDLLDGQAVKKFFDEEQPQYVILAAAHVLFFSATIYPSSPCTTTLFSCVV
jgi:GDP-L-fucose synthase